MIVSPESFGVLLLPNRYALNRRFSGNDLANKIHNAVHPFIHNLVL